MANISDEAEREECRPFEPPASGARLSGQMASAIPGLAAISRRLMKQRLATEDWVAKAGLRPPCFGVMTCIDDLEPVSQKQISDRLGLDPSDMVSVVDLLERAGFVVRVRDRGDRRRYALTLTTDGRRALRRLEAVAAEVQDTVLAPLGSEDRSTFVRLVNRVVAHHLSGPGG